MTERLDWVALLKEGSVRQLLITPAEVGFAQGLGSKDRQPVLKGKTRVWLAQRDEVIAFCQARPAEGGSGALVVLLRPTARP